MPEVSPVRSLTRRVADVFADSGTLAQALSVFESRPAQREMAEAVAETLQDGGVLLVEAGTGTGKTLAYLVPAILSGQRVLVSTGTKNLQEQIYFKDLAILREALGVPFTAAYMKGRGNFLCLHRFDAFRDSAREEAGLFGESAEQVFLPIIEQWAWPMLRASESISAKACSAVEIVLPLGVFITTTPWSVAAPRSMLSTPTPARPMALRFFAAAKTSAVTFVSERTTKP